MRILRLSKSDRACFADHFGIGETSVRRPEPVLWSVLCRVWEWNIIVSNAMAMGILRAKKALPGGARTGDRRPCIVELVSVCEDIRFGRLMGFGIRKRS